MNELIKMPARDVVGLLAKGEISPLELIDLSEARVAEVDHLVNAMPTRCFDRARDNARRLLKDGRDTVLKGLPVAIKDLNRVAGVRTTWGSPIFKDHIPNDSDIGVEVLEKNGAIVVGKSNVPELGSGGNSNNPVFGMTRNPWDTSRTSGGSSGGSAVAVATGEVWLANGSDSGCSLRLPASFCSVATIRPTPGRVPWGAPRWNMLGPSQQPWETLKVEGPLGRTVGDVALMLDAQVGSHPRDPRAVPHEGPSFLDAVDRPTKPRKVAFTPDLGGITPVAKEVADLCRSAAQRFADLGVIVEEASPDLTNMRESYDTLRALSFISTYGPLIDNYRDQVKAQTIWNVQAGENVSALKISQADRTRAEFAHRMATFFETYDLLLCPSICTPPINVELAALTELEGHKFENYYEWYTLAYAISLVACPAMSLPCAFTHDGLPVGLQLVGPWFSERSIFSAARLLEQHLGIHECLPIDPRSPRTHPTSL